MKTGYVHIYTGNGKGKTTAAMGLLLRALGAGFKVCFYQFVKNGDYSEISALENIGKKSFPDKIVVKQFGNIRKINSPFTDKDRESALNGLAAAKDAVFSGEFDIIILDEINIALHYNLIKVEDLLDLIKNKPQSLELILTGRYAMEEIIEQADLVTIMKNRKHYAENGVPARTGIEK